MKTIWKYKVEVVDYFEVEMPKDAQVLTVKLQNGTPWLWAVVNPSRLKEVRKFTVKGTGHEFFDNKDLQYIGTFLLAEDNFVGHLFEVLKKEKP